MGPPMSDQKLAYTVLTELLAYQFASPVRWIETQDVLFEEYGTERVVEIGPAPILGGIAKRTLASKYAARDSARSKRREVLSYSKDAARIYYKEDAALAQPAPTPSALESTATVAIPAVQTGTLVTVSVDVSSIDDVPIPAGDILRILVAQKMKKVLSDIPNDKSIKTLSGGKSTLQNELIGDLETEFGNLPDSAEDLPISELGTTLNSSGSLGKQSAMLIAKMMSSKMPSDFNHGIAKKYLKSRWGLGEQRQQAVLLEAVIREPTARIQSAVEAKVFLDGQVHLYATRVGLDLSSSVHVHPKPGVAAVVDPEAINALARQQNQYLTKQLDVLAKHLNVDLSIVSKARSIYQDELNELTSKLDLWSAEVGESFINGAKPVFTKLRVRTYNSWWNWVRVDVAKLYHDAMSGVVLERDGKHSAEYLRTVNRATPALLKFIKGYIISNIENLPKSTVRDQAQSFFAQLFIDCSDAMNHPPVFRPSATPSSPQTCVDPEGKISFVEVPKIHAFAWEKYVDNLTRGSTRSTQKHRLTPDESGMPAVLETEQFSNVLSRRALSSVSSESSFEDLISDRAVSTPNLFSEDERDERFSESDWTPLVHLKTKNATQMFEYNSSLSRRYFNTLRLAIHAGITFQGKYCLVTGAGAHSIGSHLVQGLIQGGAKVVVTTSRLSPHSARFYQSLYAKHGSRDSELIVVPFNQASKQDGENLMDYIYNTLNWNLDILIPFAAMPENGRDITKIDSHSELAHRMMLTNVVRIMGYTKQHKEQRGYDARPTQVLLPLSPNHGLFGGDGLYSESKIALETLVNRWASEGWNDYLSVCGAVIGWTRGTGLMSDNDLVAEAIERCGVKTFSQHEMALNLLSLIVPSVAQECEVRPVIADLSGGMHLIPNLKELTTHARQHINLTSELRKALEAEKRRELEITYGSRLSEPSTPQAAKVEPLTNLKVNFPKLPNYETEIQHLGEQLQGMIDLEQVIVATGFSELGPWGNARTRWEMEAFGAFSLEGTTEMAWIMGLIKHDPKIKEYVGWLDAKTGTPVPDSQIKAKYEREILEHSGIRLIEPGLFKGYDPTNKEILQEVAIDHDLETFEASKETALAFKKQHGAKVDITEPNEGGQWLVQLRKGATLLIPKAISVDRLVAGQIPTGFDPERYGISKDIIDQTDPVTLYTLICVSEALLSSGITDPYEVYRYIHISEVGNCIGSGTGGVTATRKMYRDRYVDTPAPKDIFQETFINTISAWVNMLLLSSSGPIKTPVGACATAVESVELGYEAIIAGKAKMCLVGGTDDFSEELSYEFGNMKATSNSLEEFAKGRSPAEMSRPTTSSRSGFMESHGAGVQVIMSAKLALEMGVPIYGIIALTNTASDKIGRSIPAPGQGILTNAREVSQTTNLPLLNIGYRKQQLQSAFNSIAAWKKSQLARDPFTTFEPSTIDFIQRESLRQQRQALRSWGNNFWQQDSRISPIRGALAVWGLTVDDIDVVSFHGTSTVANDKNESEVICKQFDHLGRREGNAVLGIYQKYLTGHPKGGAGAWMLNGCLQVINSGIVPGNRNADNVDKKLEKFDRIIYSDRTIKTSGIKAFSLTSFGFGQKGAQLIGVHPKYLFATLNKTAYQTYADKVTARERIADQRLHEMYVNNDVFIAKDKAPYLDSEESAVYLNPKARLCAVDATKTYAFDASRPYGDLEFEDEILDSGLTTNTVASYVSTAPSTPASGSASPIRNRTKSMSFPSAPSECLSEAESIIQRITEGLLTTPSSSENHLGRVGVDVESVSSLPVDNPTFVARNFSADEETYARASPAGQPAGYTSLWCAKEAVFKSLGVRGRGSGAAMKEIEITHDNNGKPGVLLHGEAKIRAERSGVANIEVSISRCDGKVTAVAVTRNITSTVGKV